MGKRWPDVVQHVKMTHTKFTRTEKLQELNYTLGDNKSNISNVETYKYLRVILHKNLLFREHIAKKTKLVNSIVVIMRKSFLNLTKDILTT